MTKKVLYTHINNAVLQAEENPSEITLRYLTGRADLTDKNNNNFVFLRKSGKKHFFSAISEHQPKTLV